MSRKCQIAIKVSKCYESHSLTNLRPCLSTYHGVESVPYWRLLRAATAVWSKGEHIVCEKVLIPATSENKSVTVGLCLAFT